MIETTKTPNNEPSHPATTARPLQLRNHGATQTFGAPADGGSPKGAGLALTADSAPGECLPVARYRLPHHTAVSFVSSDVRVFFRRIPVSLTDIRRRTGLSGDAVDLGRVPF